MRIDDNWGEEALEIIKDINANVLVTKLNKEYTYEECKQFDLIASCTTGTDHIQNKDIPLISLKGEIEFLQDVRATSEHTIALILALIRKIPAAFDDVKKGNWDREAWQGSELYGKTLGIVGYGRVGRQVSSVAKAFGIKVIWHDPYVQAQSNTIPDHLRVNRTLDNLLKESDIVTAHIPLNYKALGMFGAEQFKQMKSTAYFINTSRGAIVDEGGLITALLEKKIAGAAIDVATGEPDIWEQLRIYAKTQNNLIITPHLGGQTAESRYKTQIFIAHKIKEFIGG